MSEQLETVVGSASPQRVGSFNFYYADERWEWSDEVAAMHGYAPGTVTPTTELLLQHKHPDDRERVAAAITRAIQNGEPFSSRHRIIDATGAVRYVIVVGDRLYDDGDRVVGTTGFYIDVTEARDADLTRSVRSAVDEFERNRARIEQVKGALMFAYGIDAERAFEVLRWRSQTTNVKLSTLAEQILTELHAIDVPTPLCDTIDHLLLTAHQRTRAPARTDRPAPRPRGSGDGPVSDPSGASTG